MAAGGDSDARSSPRLGPGSWIGILLLVLVTLDLSAFLAYQQSNPGISSSSQLIGFLESSAFSVITVSVMIPLLLVFLNSFFSIGAALQQRIQSQKKEIRQGVFDAISDTGNFWDKLFMLCTEVTLLRDYGDSPQLRSLQQREAELECKGETVVTAWGSRFPNLRDEDMNLFVNAFNTLIGSMDTVIATIESCGKDPSEAAKAADLQLSLEMVRVVLANIIHSQMLTILSLSASIALNYDMGGNDLTPQQRQKISENIGTRFGQVRQLATYLALESAAGNQVLPTASGREVERFRDRAASFRTWMGHHPSSSWDDFPDIETMRDAYFAIPEAQFKAGIRTTYSPEFVSRLARGLELISLQVQLTDQGGLIANFSTPSPETPASAAATRPAPPV